MKIGDKIEYQGYEWTITGVRPGERNRDGDPQVFLRVIRPGRGLEGIVRKEIPATKAKTLSVRTRN